MAATIIKSCVETVNVNKKQTERSFMEGLLSFLVVGYLVYLIYRSGKRTGSRKGYHAGRRRRR